MEDTIPHLERKAAEDFVTNRLLCELPEDPNDLTWINNIIKSFQKHIPYQNITLLQDEIKGVPQWDNIYNDCIVTSKGGLCLSLNVALAAIFSAFGLPCYLVSATYVATKTEGVHSIVLLECKSSNSQHRRSSNRISRRSSLISRLKNIYLADVGCGFPTLQAIHLYSELGKVFSDCGLEYKFVQRRNMYERLHRKGDEIPEEEKNIIRNGWRVVFSFTLTPRPFEHFQKTMEPIYLDPVTSPYFTEIDVVRYFSKHDMIALKNDFVIMSSMKESKEKTFSNLETELNTLYSNELPNKDLSKDMEVVWFDDYIRKVKLKCSRLFLAKVIMQFFPMIPDYETEKAIGIFYDERNAFEEELAKLCH
ncbi:uncharacterized protein LOC143024644 [Oratosquilla oratoria]|uniref:uncharacterized protein LOC143024644 n=1 Tax=Oratosquilla oratoria TaxID=337810 RepID=UPI003F773621